MRVAEQQSRSVGRRGRGVRLAMIALVLGSVVAALSSVTAAQSSNQGAGQKMAVSPAMSGAPTLRAVVDKYCVTCHNQKLKTAGLTLDTVDTTQPHANPDVWERVIKKLRARAMPPAGMPRPDGATYDAVATSLEEALDRAWLAQPNPGRIAAVQRLNRMQYKNAIRDLFAVDVDVESKLPGDETADGSFDNLADVLSISTLHLERYLSVARQVTRLAIGLPPVTPGNDRFEISLHVLQDDQENEDLPFGSRGGMAIPYDFPVEGEYLIKVRLRRQYQDYIMGMGWPQQLDIRLDGQLLQRFTVGGNAPGRPAASSYAGDGQPGFAGDDEWEKYMQITADAGLEVRVPVKAGRRVVGVSFVRELWEPEGLPQPLQRERVLTNDQIYMGYAAVEAVQIGGPFEANGSVAKDTPSRRAIFVCTPRTVAEEEACATKILSRLARLAYRRPVTKTDVQTLLTFFANRRRAGTFDEGIQFGLERMLVDPDFLLRVHRDPAVRPGAAASYRLSDLEVASRLSFFLWNSIPDDRLLQLAERGQLTKAPTLEQEVRRMLAEPRAVESLVTDFAAQWLNLRRVGEVVVDSLKYPTYDETLLHAFKQETELFLASTLREDRSVTDLLKADYTFVNERLARHYNIPGIYGSRFRRVTLSNPAERGGLLGNGALLATTSYPDRTSPVLRGKWLLDNIFGYVVPAPPPNVNTNLPEPKPGDKPLPIRERLAQHRKNPVCAPCHAVMDPIGFALENFDVIGAWRTLDESGQPVDASGVTAGGAKISGLSGLRAFLLEQPDQFPHTVTEKLMTYALSRRLEADDRPAVRKIVRDAAARDYRWSAIILGIVQSPAFLMRNFPEATAALP